MYLYHIELSIVERENHKIISNSLAPSPSHPSFYLAAVVIHGYETKAVVGRTGSDATSVTSISSFCCCDSCKAKSSARSGKEGRLTSLSEFWSRDSVGGLGSPSVDAAGWQVD